VPIHGSVLLLALLALPYLFAALSLGILTSSKANSQPEAMQLAFLPILPSVFLSGYIFPRETMPAIFKTISYMVPATYFINITRGVILGAQPSSIFGPTAWPSFSSALFYSSSPRAASRKKSSWPEVVHS